MNKHLLGSHGCSLFMSFARSFLAGGVTATAGSLAATTGRLTFAVVGCVKARTFEYDRRAAADQALRSAAALRTLGKRFVTHVLEFIEGVTATITFVFIRGHFAISPEKFAMRKSCYCRVESCGLCCAGFSTMISEFMKSISLILPGTMLVCPARSITSI